MTLLIEPEIGVPFSDDISLVDLKERAAAACNTAQKLAEHGLDLAPTKEDEDIAAKLAVAYADDPEKTSKAASTRKTAVLTPASLVLTNNILQEFVWQTKDVVPEIPRVHKFLDYWHKNIDAVISEIKVADTVDNSYLPVKEIYTLR